MSAGLTLALVVEKAVDLRPDAYGRAWIMLALFVLGALGGAMASGS